MVRVNPKTMPMFPAGFLGGRLAVAAGATTVPGGRDVCALYREAATNITYPARFFTIHGSLPRVKLPRYTLVAAGAPPRHMKTLAARFLASNSKGGRLSAVVAAGTTSPGENSDGLPSEDCQAAVSTFRMEMDLFNMSQRTLALVGSPTDELMDGALGTAKDCRTMVEFLLTKVSVSRESLKELINVGKAFLIVEGQAKEGYVKADALANVIKGLKLVANTFFKGFDLPGYSAPVVPLCADDVDKESFFKELINVFIVLYTALEWEARKKYGFKNEGAN